MLKQILAGTAAVAAMGLATSAMAVHGVPGQNLPVEINIEVHEEASMWPADFHVDLNLTGANAENSDAFQSQISHINNTAADISATVTGSGGFPSGGELIFYLFDNTTDAAAIAAIAANANAPAGGLRWDSTNEGANQFVVNVATTQSVLSRPVAYAAAAPNSLPLPGEFDITLTWTIAPNP
jgi:hypothetical protein